MSSGTVGISLDLNKFMEAYNKADFMKSVFIDYLVKNPDVVAKAVGNYVIADLVKSDHISKISEKVKDTVDKYLEEISNTSPYNSPLKNSINQIISASVTESKGNIDRRVAQAISNEVTASQITTCITNMVNRRIAEVIGELADSD